MKRTSIVVSLAVGSSLAAAALAQQGPARPAAPAMPRPAPPNPATPPVSPTPAADGNRVFRSMQEIPKSEIVAPVEGVALAEGRVDDYLVQKEHGPFMVMAKTFRGPDAARYAVALTRELREEFKLPAYIWYVNVKPARSNVRGVPPTAPVTARNGDVIAGPRVYDEAAVLVGNYKTTDEANEALHHIKKLKPRCINAMPQWAHRWDAGLKYAYYTTNPLQATQNLYPGREIRQHGGETFDPYAMIASLTKTPKIDSLVVKMNKGDRSIYKCPGPYTLQVAEFHGNTVTTTEYAQKKYDGLVGKSPLGRAYDDAERLADALSHYPQVTKSARIYTFHDLSSSKVFLGNFRSEVDPAMLALQEQMPKITGQLMLDKRATLPLIAVPVLVGTAQGTQIFDNQVQRTGGASRIDLIPIPAKDGGRGQVVEGSSGSPRSRR